MKLICLVLCRNNDMPSHPPMKPPSRAKIWKVISDMRREPFLLDRDLSIP